MGGEKLQHNDRNTVPQATFGQAKEDSLSRNGSKFMSGLDSF